MALGGAATMADLVEEVVSNLYGFANAYDVMVGLSAEITANSLVLPLDNVDGVSRGVVQIDGELIWIDSVDRSTKLAKVASFGRGFRGTTATNHRTGSVVTVSPTWPQVTVAREINNVVLGLYPSVFAVEHTDITLAKHQRELLLPFTAERILGVRMQDRLGNWQTYREWDYLRETDGVRISLYGETPSEAVIRVLYSESPAPMQALEQGFAATTGLPESCRDVVTIGAESRLLPYLDVARLPVTSAEADEMNQTRPVGAALQLSQELKKTYQSRLLVEQGKLQDRYPVQMRRTR